MVKLTALQDPASRFGFTALIALLLVLAIHLHAAPRPWKSPDGERSVQGEFLARDERQITIRRSDGLVFTLDIKKVHPDDLQWLDDNHPLPKAQAPDLVPDNTSVFDTLHFGDTREQVLAKLRSSKLVELRVAESLLGRFGLNGTFQTRKDIGGLRCQLFFDWSARGLMREVSLQTESLPADAYPTRLKPCWEEFAKLLATLYGRPAQEGRFPSVTELTDGAFLGTHVWRLEGGGSAILGTARDNKGYTTVVRFIQQGIQPFGGP